NLVVPADAAYTQKYWLVKPPAGDVYQVDDVNLLGRPDNPPAAQMRISLTIDGTPIELVRPVQHRYADRAQGERVRPFVVVPSVAVNLPVPVAVFPDSSPRRVQVSVQANTPNAEGELGLDLPAGWKADPATLPFHISLAGEAQEITFFVTPPAGETTASLRAVAKVGGREISNGMQVISYPHIPAQ